MKKQLQELTIMDLENNPVWFFVGQDQEDSDELTIKPATQNEVNEDISIIVKCIFKTKGEKEYVGYNNWQAPFTIEATQPLLLLKDNIELVFWYGMFTPEDEVLKIIKRNVGENFFPLKFESISIFGLNSIAGTLEGLYHYDDNELIKLVKID